MRSFFALAAIFSLCLFVYFPGLSASFYLDDISSIVTSSYVTQNSLSGILEFQTYKRVLGDVSFFLSHKIDGLNPSVFRATNIIIHCINGLLVFQFARALQSTLNVDKRQASLLALFVAACFLLHTLNTQAITYIVQRYTALMTLFSLTSLIFYLKARAEQNILFFVVSVISFIFALFSKETAVVCIPIVLAIEYTIFAKHKLISRFISLSILGLFVIQFAVFMHWVDLSVLDAKTRDDFSVARLDYFKAQMYVIAYYMANFFGQTGNYLEYDETVRSVLRNEHWMHYFLMHCFIFTLFITLKKKMPLAALGILGFYLALSLESTFIPIRDVIVEHRMYFPSVFLTIACVDLLYRAFLATNIKFNSSLFIYSCIFICGLLAYSTYNRNLLWADETAFYRNELRNSPNHWRIKNALVINYVKNGDLPAARLLLKDLLVRHKGLYYPPVLLNGIMLFRESEPKLARIFEDQLFDKIRQVSLPNRARAYYYRGERLYKSNKLLSAKVHFEQAIRLYYDLPDAHIALARTLIKLGKSDKALENLKDASGKLSQTKQINEAISQLTNKQKSS